MRLIFGVFFGIIAFILFFAGMIVFTEDNDLRQAIQLGTFGAEDVGYLIGVFLPSLIMAYISHRILKKRRMNIKRKEWMRKNQEEIEAYWKSPEGRRESLIGDLTDISGVSDKIARTLVDQFPTSESIQEASVEELSDIPGVGSSIAKAIKARIG